MSEELSVLARWVLNSRGYMGHAQSCPLGFPDVPWHHGSGTVTLEVMVPIPANQGPPERNSVLTSHLVF